MSTDGGAFLRSVPEVDMADVHGDHLKDYWVAGPGAAKIRWGTPGDFDRCVTHLRKYVTDPEGLCNVLHRKATGSAPGKGH